LQPMRFLFMSVQGATWNICAHVLITKPDPHPGGHPFSSKAVGKSFPCLVTCWLTFQCRGEGVRLPGGPAAPVHHRAEGVAEDGAYPRTRLTVVGMAGTSCLSPVAPHVKMFGK
jgi:hypothetical protein